MGDFIDFIDLSGSETGFNFESFSAECNCGKPGCPGNLSQEYDKAELPENYLESLNDFLVENQFNKDKTDYTSFNFSIKGNDVLTDLSCYCKYFYFLGENMDDMINDFKEKEKNKLPFEKEDEDSDDEDSLFFMLNLKNKFSSKTSYGENKKAIIFIMSTMYGNLPIFIDDIGMKFTLKVEDTEKVFDTDSFTVNKA